MLPRLAFTLAIGFAFLLSASVLAAPARAGLSQVAAGAFVSGLGEELVEVLHEGDGQSAARDGRLRGLIGRALAVREMAKDAVGSQWSRASVDQRERYVTVFRRYLLASCIDRLDGPALDSLELLSVAPATNGGVMVVTRAARGIFPLADIGWLVREVDGAPRIVDIAIDGYSLAAGYRSEFRSVLYRQGLDALILVLAQKAPSQSLADTF